MNRDPKEIGQIVRSPDTLGGKPRIAGTRISVETILEELAAGTTTEQLLEMFPFITQEDIRAAIFYALSSLRHEAIFPLPEKAS